MWRPKPNKDYALAFLSRIRKIQNEEREGVVNGNEIFLNLNSLLFSQSIKSQCCPLLFLSLFRIFVSSPGPKVFLFPHTHITPKAKSFQTKGWKWKLSQIMVTYIAPAPVRTEGGWNFIRFQLSIYLYLSHMFPNAKIRSDSKFSKSLCYSRLPFLSASLPASIFLSFLFYFSVSSSFSRIFLAPRSERSP